MLTGFDFVVLSEYKKSKSKRVFFPFLPFFYINSVRFISSYIYIQ